MFLIIFTKEKNTNATPVENILLCTIGGSPGDVSEEPVTLEKREKGWIMRCDVGEATAGLENKL